MHLILLSDIHGSLNFLPPLQVPLQEADGVIIAGDITTFGDAQASAHILEGIATLNPRIFAVSGNCDLKDVDPYLHEQGIGLHATCRQSQGIDFIGVSGSLPCPGSTPNESGEAHFVACLEQAKQTRAPGARPLVLVSHQPAYGTELDRTRGGGHAGSTALRDFIEQEKPLLAVSGHIHEAAGTDQVGRSTLVNPGPFKDGCFAQATIEDEQVKIQLDRV